MKKKQKTHGRKQTHNRQHRATHINPDHRKAQSDIARGPGLLNIHKHCQKATWNYWINYNWIKGSLKRFDWMIKSITTERIILFIS